MRRLVEHQKLHNPGEITTASEVFQKPSFVRQLRKLSGVQFRAGLEDMVRVDPDTLRRLRQEQGLTTHQLAAKAGVAHTVVTGAETGSTKLHVGSVCKLAAALGVSVSTLTAWKATGG